MSITNYAIPDNDHNQSRARARAANTALKAERSIDFAKPNDFSRPAEQAGESTAAWLSRVNNERGHSFAQNNIDPNSTSAESESALSFADLIDVINPLQHIPLISGVYRAVTGDEISAPARVAGGALFLGSIGAASAVANLALEEATGSDLNGHLAALFTGNDSAPDETITADATDTINASPVAAALGAPSGGMPNGDILPAATAFSFSAEPADSAALPTAPETQAPGFAPQIEPLALESLPADILAALYSGQTMRSTGDSAPANTQANTQSETGMLWGLPPEAQALHSETANALKAYTANSETVPGTIAQQGGWFAAATPDIIPEALAQYQGSANLQRQTAQPLVDVSP